MLRILVVDRNNKERVQLHRQLLQSGFALEIETVDNDNLLRSALAKQDWDIIAVGRPLEGLSQEDAAHIIRQEKPELPILFLPEKNDIFAVARIMSNLKYALNGCRVLPTILESVPQSIFWKDKNGVYLGCNSSFAKIVGYDNPEDIIGKTDFDLPWTRQETEAFRTDDKWVMETGFTKRQNVEPRRKADGTTILANIIKAPLIDYEGNVCGVIGIYEDLTEHLQSDAALRQSEEMLKLVLNTIPSWVFWKDINCVYLGCNYLFASNAGLKSPQDIMGKTDYDLPWTKEEADRYRADDKTVMESGIPKLNYEETQTTADGRTKWIRTSKVPLKDHEGNVIGVLGTFEDFTREREANEALRESEERYRTVFNSNLEAFVLIDLSGYIIDANPVACALYGYSREELVGMHARNLISPEFYSSLDSFIETGINEWFRTSAINIRKDGSRFEVEIEGTRVYYRGKEQLITVIKDVTERNKIRDELQMHADIVRNMQVGLYVYHLEDLNDDRTLKLVAANPRSTIELGLDKDKTIGRYIDDIFPRLRELQLPQRFAEVVRTGEPFSIEDIAYYDSNVSPRRDSVKVFRIPGNRVGVLFEDKTELRRIEEERRQFYRETISSVTDGKLIISSQEELQPFIIDSALTYKFSTAEELSTARQELQDYCTSKSLEGDRLALFLSGVGEAMNNALKHAGKGIVFAGCKDNTVWIGISDDGPGISTLALPRATLRRGYSTKVSMGMGYSIMIEVADRVMLSTGPQGTTVVLITNLKEAAPEMSLADLPDIWDQVPNI